MARHILDKVRLLARLATQNLPEAIGLHEILIGDGELFREDSAGPLLVLLAGFDGHVIHPAEGGWIVGVGAVIAVDGHRTVALVRVKGAQRAVDGDLLVVDAKAVAMGVWVGEEAGLQDWVCGGLDAGDQM